MPASTHTDRDYERELADLSHSLTDMSVLVETMIGDAIESLQQRDAVKAKQLVDTDHRVNQAELDIDSLCLNILVRRQPMGKDLRLITRALKMVTDLERIGDLAVNIGERTLDLHRSGWVDIPESFLEMSRLVQSMLRDAISAFVQQDVDAARQVIARDDQIDAVYSSVFEQLLREMDQRREFVQSYIHLQSAAKFIERMGDHTTNLAEQVVFMVRGEEIRHEGHL